MVGCGSGAPGIRESSVFRFLGQCRFLLPWLSLYSNAALASYARGAPRAPSQMGDSCTDSQELKTLVSFQESASR